MPAVNITSGEYAKAQAARAELDQMLLFGTVGGGTIAGPFTGLTGVPGAALDLYEVIHLALQRMMQGFQALNNVAGPYPLTSGSFTTRGGALLLLASASCYPTTPAGLVTLDVKVDAGVVGSMAMYHNETEHSLHARSLLVTGVAAGAHTFGIAHGANASSDGGDRASLVVIELPF